MIIKIKVPAKEAVKMLIGADGGFKYTTEKDATDGKDAWQKVLRRLINAEMEYSDPRNVL